MHIANYQSCFRHPESSGLKLEICMKLGAGSWDERTHQNKRLNILGAESSSANYILKN